MAVNEFFWWQEKKKARDEYSSTLKHRWEYNSAHKEMVRGLESSTPYQKNPKKTQESLPVHYSYKFKENLNPLEQPHAYFSFSLVLLS